MDNTIPTVVFLFDYSNICKKEKEIPVCCEILYRPACWANEIIRLTSDLRSCSNLSKFEYPTLALSAICWASSSLNLPDTIRSLTIS